MALRRTATSISPSLRSLLRALSSSSEAAPASSPHLATMLPAAASSGSGAAQQSRRAAASSSSSSPSLPSPPNARTATRKPTGYVWSELMFWHNPGEIGDLAARVQPTRHLEHAETKRRLHNLVGLSGLLSGAASSGSPRSSPSPSGGRSSGSSKRSGPALVEIEPRMATIAELERAHDPSYVAEVLKKSNDPTASVHRIGDESAFAPGGFEVAALSAGAALAATEAVLSGQVAGAYALSRPPGHHATRVTGGGFCLFNNVAIAALHALEAGMVVSSAEEEEEEGEDEDGEENARRAAAPSAPVERIAIVDFDVHHGNGTQDIFYKDDRVLFISLHQDGNYPLEGGKIDEVGTGKGEGFNLNVPLPPGSGSGCYRGAFDRVVIPALDAFQPDLVLVSAGYDAGYMDPLGQMMLGSHDYRYFMRRLRAAAARHSRGRLVAVHEGGYSDAYVPFCGLAAIEAMCGAGTRSRVVDPYWADVSAFAYQALQPWQDAVLREVEEGPLRLLKARCEEQQEQKEAAERASSLAAVGSRGRGRAPAARPTVPGGGGGGGAAASSAARKAAAAASPPPAATSLPRRVSGGNGGNVASRTAAREPEAACG